jgi:glycerol-3-phosphate dehydrogenase
LHASLENTQLSIYGNNALEIASVQKKNPELAKKIHPELPYTWAELTWICEHEMIVHLEDILARRLRAILLNASATLEIAEEVAKRIKPIMQWTEEDVKQELSNFKTFANNYLLMD